MIRDRFLTRAEWEERLRGIGAEPLEGKGQLNTAEWWRFDGKIFTVPVEDESGRCDFWAVQILCEQLTGPRLFSGDLSPDDR